MSRSLRYEAAAGRSHRGPPRNIITTELTVPQPARRMSKSKCRLAQDCSLCPQRIKVGTWMALDFGSNEWVHLGCLMRKINARSPDGTVKISMSS